MSLTRCWCGHDKAQHADAMCVSCQKWRRWLDPKHLFRPIDTLTPIPAALYRPVMVNAIAGPQTTPPRGVR